MKWAEIISQKCQKECSLEIYIIYHQHIVLLFEIFKNTELSLTIVRTAIDDFPSQVKSTNRSSEQQKINVAVSCF